MKKVAFLLIALSAVAIGGCSSDRGELTGAKNRPIFNDIDLYGMVNVPEGSFIMGSGDLDQPYAYSVQNKTVQVRSFWMDETEITNNEYRQFVEWVKDSIAHMLLGAADIEGYVVAEDEFGEPIDPPMVNWKKKINYNSKDESEREALAELYSQADSRYRMGKSLDIKKLNYEYYWLDMAAAARKESYDNTPEELKGSSFANRPKGIRNPSQFIRREVINVYPDTLCWIHDYAYSWNEDLARGYFSSPAYDDYPVVGVTWKQAKAFSHWRTQLLNSYLASASSADMDIFRLPSEAEWEYAARGGIAMEPYPWGGPYLRNSKFCFLGNYQPLRGRYSDDDGPVTLMVGHYAPNDFGLYDMAGNVSEWCEDAYSKSTYFYAHNFMQVNSYDAKDDDKPVAKQKVIRGGSWKDTKHYMQVSARTYEYQDTGKCYVGFRNVQSYRGRQKGDNLRNASNVAR